MDYQLIRSARRKTIALHIQSGKLTVRAPYAVNKQFIDDLVINKQAWIEAKLNAQRQRELSVQDEVTLLANDGRIWFKGIQHRLELCFSANASVVVKDGVVTVSLEQRYQGASTEKINALLQRRIEQWMKAQANVLLLNKLAKYAELTHLEPKAVRIRQYRARWGSCNSEGVISFNYLLMMAPEWVIDYVVVHELCHLEHLNHSPSFWHLVATFYPNYVQAKHWLKQHQYQLTWPKKP